MITTRDKKEPNLPTAFSWRIAPHAQFEGWPPHSMPARRGPDLSVVVPCFDEEAGLVELHRRITAVCRQVADYEIVLVNDGSGDGTWNLMRRLADADARLVVINLSRNHGHQLALS